MSGIDDSSVRELQRNAERSRIQLAETVVQLRSKVSDTVTEMKERVSPTAIKAEINDYVRARGEMLADKARQNPLQAAAIGLGLAYPLLGIARSIPAPVWMIGTGLFLMGSTQGQRATRQVAGAAGALAESIGDKADAALAATHAAKDAASEKMHSARVGVDSTLAGVREKSAEASHVATEAARQATETVIGYRDHALDTAGALTEKASASARSATDSLRQTISGAAAATQDAFGAARDFGSEAALQVRDQTVASSDRLKTAIGDGFQQNPLIVGAIGVAIGALIAGLLPRSDAEVSLIGGMSSDVKKRAADLAGQGFDSAKGALSEVLAETASRAESEGVTAEDVQEATRDLGRRVRKVAETATTKAFELPNQSKNDAV